MFNEKDIIARLANGENPADIANAFATMLNKAIADRRAQEEKENKRADIVKRLGDLLVDYVNLELPEYAGLLEGEDVYATAAECLDNMTNLIHLGIQELENVGCDCGCADCTDSCGDSIADFLKSFNL